MIYPYYGQSPKKRSSPDDFLPRVGPFSDSPLIRCNSLPNMGPADVVGFAWNFFKVSRTAPLRRNIINLSGTFAAVVPDPSDGFGYSMFVQAHTINIGPGQGFGTAQNGMADFPDGSRIAGLIGDLGFGGQAGFGGAGGAGGNADGNMVGLTAQNGSNSGGNGPTGQQTGSGVGGGAGRGTGASDLAGSPWVPFAVGGGDGSGNVSILPGIGAAGKSGSTPNNIDNYMGGSGSGGSYCGLVCWVFGGSGPASQGIIVQGGDGAADYQSDTQETFGGGGGILELFTAHYDGSLAAFCQGGTGSLGTPAISGDFRIYELNRNGIIIATHTNAADTWNNL